MPMTVEDVRAELANAHLPNDMDVEIRDDIVGLEGRYIPGPDRLQVRSAAHPFWVLHEGAHAEHWGKLGLRLLNPVPPLELQTGILHASEVYVGRRLANVHGYHTYEWNTLKSIPGFPDSFQEWADLYDVATFVGAGGTRLMRFVGMRILMRSLPLLGVELANGDLDFFEDLKPRQGIPGLLCSIVEKLKAFTPGDLENKKLLAEFGADVLARLAEAGVTVDGMY